MLNIIFLFREEQKEDNLELDDQVDVVNEEHKSVEAGETRTFPFNDTSNNSDVQENFNDLTTEDNQIDNTSESESKEVDSVNIEISTSGSNIQATKKIPSILEFFHTDAQLYTYTGIKSFAILDCIVECIEELRKGNKKRTINLSIKDSVVLTFIKLKQNQSYRALGILFNINSKMTKKYFISTLKELAHVFNVLIRWPSKEEILNNMPKCFANYKSTRIVLDCLEIAIRQSKCLKCRIPTYSNYKSHHTVKFMLGVTPSGNISYVSKAYGGRVSDKFIFNQSNILQRSIRCVDSIMVDRGFLIDKECAEYGIKLIRPPFLKKKIQLSHKEAVMNARIAAARVHVERRIQRIRVFKVLQGPLETEIIPYINIIMRVICGITNLESPILAEDKFLSNN